MSECPDWCPVCGAELKAQDWPVKHADASTGQPCSFQWHTNVTEVFAPVAVPFILLVGPGEDPQERALYEAARDAILRRSREDS